MRIVVVGGAELEVFRGLVVLVDRAAGGAGQLAGVGDDCVEHRLKIEGRAEGLADLAQRLQLLDRAGELGRAGLQLAEQPRVLDGDGRLVRKGLHQGDLAVGKRQDLMPVDNDHPQQLVRPEHGDPKHGPDGVHLRRTVGVLGVGQDILKVYRAPFEGSASRCARAREGQGVTLEECYELGGCVVGGHDAQHLPVETVDQRAFGRTQRDRVLSECLEDRLEIERGAADHLEQLAGRRLLLERDSQLAIARLQFLE